MDRKNFIRYQLPVFIWALLIWLGSSIQRLPDPNTVFPHLDKIAHFFEYGVLGFLMTRSFYYHPRVSVSRRAVSLALVLGLVFASVDEFHQLFVPGRFASLWDLAADTLGLICAQLSFYIIVIKRQARQSRF
jgi:VanZ family protein